jgi:cyclin H
MYMKRFYLYNTVMDYSPKHIMLTCLYMATKTENAFLSIDEFTKKFSNIKPNILTELEMIIAQSLQFHFTIRHPFRPLYGFYLDLQVGHVGILHILTHYFFSLC